MSLFRNVYRVYRAMDDARNNGNYADNLRFPLLERKKQIDLWDGEDEEVYTIIDRRLSLVLWILNSFLILSFFLMAAAYSGGTDIFESGYMMALFFITVVSVFVVIFEMLIIGQKCVDSAKRINPKKCVVL